MSTNIPLPVPAAAVQREADTGPALSARRGRPRSPGPGRTRKRGGAQRRRDNALLALGLPAVFWYAVFTIGPLFAMCYLSLRNKSSFITPSDYTGFANFDAALHDEVFWAATRHTVEQMVVVLPVMIPLAFMLGYYLSLRPPAHGVLRVVLFTPALVSLSAKAMVFLSVFAPNGALNGLFDLLHLSGHTTPWLANTSTALPTVIAVDLWSGIGFTAVLFSARLSGVSSEVYEAARLDGAGHWRRMWQIAYPMVRDYFGVLAMLQFLWVLFNSAGTILLLTRGGPGEASTTLSYLVYDKAFVQSQVGYSQAVGVLLFVVGIVGMVAIRRAFRPSF